MRVTAIDPGGVRKGCSLALLENRELIAVAPVVRLNELGPWACDRVVVERPQQDGRSRSVPPAILMDLSWQAALLVGGLAVHGRAEIVEYTPDDWKGQIQKAQQHANMIESGALTQREIDVVGAMCGPFGLWESEVFEARRKGALSRWARHANAHYPTKSRLSDVLDTVALGLFDAGRITKDGKRK